MVSKGRILLMDDEESILDVTKEVLSFLGYEVAVANEGSEAIRLYQEGLTNGIHYDVVILDLTVPRGMGGEETLHKLKELDPNVRAVVSSGHSMDPNVADFRGHGFSGVLSKPYKIKDLGDLLAGLIPPKA